MPLDKRPWYRQPLLKAVPKLIEFRNELRAKNLHDTEDGPLTGPPPLAPGAPELTQRTFDGTYNDLNQPRMGCVHARLGRNVPLSEAKPDRANLLNPNPRVVSQTLMTREQFQPVPFLNLLAASWIQFQTHDWFNHGLDKHAPDPIEVPIDAADSWPEKPMRIPRTPVDPTYSPASGKPPVYRNLVTHWWDGSQVYGSSAEVNATLRTGEGGKMKIQQDGKLPVDPDTGGDLTGFGDNGWVGLSMLHALFVLEHNSICDRFAARHPDWTDDQLFAKARLVNAALMAKIHTVEWTPAILPNDITVKALRTNWYGFLDQFGERLQKLLPGLNDSELIGGIVGSHADHHTAPYAMTEEFVCVYRMHALMPDDFSFHRVADGQQIAAHTLPEVSGRSARDVVDALSMTDMFYSFGAMMHPGMIRLHNYPNHLRNLRQDDGFMFDMAAVDIMRDRERGVPRYNRFRELLHMPRIDTFEKLTDNPRWREEIRAVYGGNIDLVDTQVGLMCEPLPQGFGFAESAFRVFILMASRRLKSDRFFTDSWKPEVYTPEGIAWVENTSFKDILTRHFPALAPALEGIDNPFNPWRRHVNGRWQAPE